MRRSTMPIRVLGLGIASAAATAILLVAVSSSAQGQTSSVEAQQTVDRLIPGAVVRLQPVLPRGALELNVVLPGQALPASSVPDAARQFAYAELGWRLELATASLTSALPALTGYHATDAAGRVPLGAGDDLDGTVQLAPGDLARQAVFDTPKLGSVSAQQANAQVQANLAVLRTGTAGPVLGNVNVSTVPINEALSAQSPGFPVLPTGRRFALSVDLPVDRVSALADQYGNIFNGLATGLVGDASATIEGLSITLHDASGARITSWTTARASTGNFLAGPGLQVPSTLSVTLPFVNLTNGSPPLGSVFGTAGEAGSAGGHTPGTGPITLRSGSSRARTARGYICPSNAGCAGASPRPPGKLRLRPGGQLVIEVGHPAQHIGVSLASGTGAYLRGLAPVKEIRPGTWATRIPHQLTRVRSIQVTVDTTTTSAFYQVGARTARRMRSHCHHQPRH